MSQLGLYDILKMMFTPQGRQSIYSMDRRIMPSYGWVINRTMAIKFPQYAQQVSLFKVEDYDVVLFWCKVLESIGVNRVDPFIYTKGEKRMFEEKRKEVGLPDKKTLSEYMRFRHLSEKDIDALVNMEQLRIILVEDINEYTKHIERMSNPTKKKVKDED